MDIKDTIRTILAVIFILFLIFSIPTALVGIVIWLIFYSHWNIILAISVSLILIVIAMFIIIFWVHALSIWGDIL